MTQIDIAKLKRMRTAVSALVSSSQTNDMSSGLVEAYVKLREQVITAVPEGLVSELTAICPEMTTLSSRADIIRIKLEGDKARAFLVGLDGWLEAVIES